MPEGTDGGGGTKTDNSSESTGLNSIDQVNFGPEGGGDPTEAGLDDDPSVLEIDRDREDPATTGDTGATDKADGSGGPEPDLGPRPAVDLTAPVDLGPATGPITSSSFAVDVEPGPGDDTAEGTDENDLLGSTGRFGTGAVDPGPEGDTIVSTVGPDLDASMPDLDAQRGSEGAPVDALEIAMELPVVEEMSPREADPVFDELDDAKLGDVDIRDIDSDAIETFFNG